MDEISRQFNTSFEHWDIQLPPGDIEQRRSGRILEAGWAIWYLFGSDAEGEYLDFYASHRMTDDRHVRIREGGRREGLQAIQGFHMTSTDPVEKARLEEEYFAQNRLVAELLEAKGFGLRGDEPGGVQMNRYLHLNRVDAPER